MMMAACILLVQSVLEAEDIDEELTSDSEDEDAMDVDSNHVSAENFSLWHEAVLRATLICCCYSNYQGGGWWVKERSLIWFDYFLWHSYESDRWKLVMHMPKNLFVYFVSRLAPAMQKQDTRWRKAVPPEVRVGVLIHRLVSGHNYFMIGDRFGVGESTVQEIVQEGVNVVISELGSKYLSWPDELGLALVAEGFKRRCGLPNCYGAIDGSYIRIRAPIGKEITYDFYNRKGFHLIVLQALTDVDGSFLDVFIGMPGSTNEKRVLRCSTLYHRVLRGEILAQPVITINDGVPLSPYILGDSGYFMQPWLMMPYSIGPGSTFLQRKFTESQIQGRLCVEQAFGVLKRRFNILEIGISSDIAWATKFVHACCIIHNVLVKNRVGVRRDIQEAVEADLQNMQVGGVNAPRPQDSGENVRSALAEYLTGIQ